MSKSAASNPPKYALKPPSVKAVGKGLWNWCIDKRLYFLAFFLPVAVMFAAYAVFGVHPFGDESVLVLDLNGQYVYYYELLHDAFWGERSLTAGEETFRASFSEFSPTTLQAPL